MDSEIKIDLPDYKKIASGTKKRKVSVEPKEVEAALSWLQKSRAKFSLKNQPARKGDFIEIEYTYEGAKPIKDGFILGQGHFTAKFEQNLLGTKDGENKEFSLNWQARLPVRQGKKTNFKVKVNSVQKVQLPEVNDQFAQNLGKFDNLTALKKSIKQGINTEKETAESQRVRQEILEKISQQCEAEPPVILKAISEKENINVSEAEVNEAVNNLLKHYPDIEKAQKLDLEKLKRYSEEVIRNEKTFALLESFVKC